MNDKTAESRLWHHFLGPTPTVRIVLLVVLISLATGQVTSARQPAAITVMAQQIAVSATSSWQPSSPDPSGIAFWPAQDRLLIVDGEVDEMSIFTGANIFASNRAGTLLQTGNSVRWSREPVGIAIHPLTQHVFVSDDDQKAVFEVQVGGDMQPGTADDTIRSFSTRAYDNGDPEGLTFDNTGTLYLTNGDGARVHRITAGANGIFDGPAPVGDDQATSWETRTLGQPDPEGIAYHNSLLYIVSNTTDATIAEVTLDGRLERTISLANVMPQAPADLTWAPASTGGGEEHIYLVARGIDNDQDPRENDGRLYEIAIPATPHPARFLLPLFIRKVQD